MASSATPTLRRVASGTPSPGPPASNDGDDATRVAPLLCRTQRVPHTRRPDAGGSAVTAGNGGGPGGSAARLKGAPPPHGGSTAKAAAAVTVAPPRGSRRLSGLFGKTAAKGPPPTAGAAAPAGGWVQPAGAPPRVLPPGGGRGGWRPRRKNAGAVAPRGATLVVDAPAGGGGGGAAAAAPTGAAQGTRVEVPVVDPRRGDPAFRRTVSWVTGTAATAAAVGGIAPPADAGAADAEVAAVAKDAGGLAQGDTTGADAMRTEPLPSTPTAAPQATGLKEQNVEVAEEKEAAVAPVTPNEASPTCVGAAPTAPPLSVADKVADPAAAVHAVETDTIGATTAGGAPTLLLPPPMLPPMPPLPEEEAVLWGGVDVPAAAPFPSVGPPPSDKVTAPSAVAATNAFTPASAVEVATSAGRTDAPVDGCGRGAGGDTATNGAASPTSQTLPQTTQAFPLVTLLETQERADAGDGAAAVTAAPASTAMDSVAAAAGGAGDGAVDGRGDGVVEVIAATDSGLLPQPKTAPSPQTEPLEALLQLQEEEEADGSGAEAGEPAKAALSSPTGSPLSGNKPRAPAPRRSATDGVAAATGADEDGRSASSAAPQRPSPTPTTKPPPAPSPSPTAPLVPSTLPEEEAAVRVLHPPGAVAPDVVPQTPPMMQEVPLMTVLELQEQEAVDEIEVAVPAAPVAPARAAPSALKSCAAAARRSATDVMATAAGSDGDGTSASSSASPSSRPPSPLPPSTLGDQVEVAPAAAPGGGPPRTGAPHPPSGEPAPAGPSSAVTADDGDGVCPLAPQPVVPLARSPTPDRPEGPPTGIWLSHTVLGRTKERFDALMARLRAAPSVQRPPQANRGFLRLPRWARRPSTV